MTFGAAATPQDVPAYLADVRGSKPSPELVAEFQRRYRLAGGSPLIRNTWAQALALERLLNSPSPQSFQRSLPHTPVPRVLGREPTDPPSTPSFPRRREPTYASSDNLYKVSIGMRHTPPFIEDGLTQLAAKGVTQVIALILSPQYSPYIMGGYHRALDEAREAIAPDLQLRVAEAWHTLPAFIDALASRVAQALETCPKPERNDIAILMTAHSLPKVVADREPGYLQQLRATATAVAQQLGLSPGQWQFAYQSAGHTPQEWLRPDISELFPALRQSGHRRALVVPVQFLSDHLEVLYDIDVAARQQADQAGIELMRIQTPGVMPQLVQALASVVHRELEKMPCP